MRRIYQPVRRLRAVSVAHGEAMGESAMAIGSAATCAHAVWPFTTRSKNLARGYSCARSGTGNAEDALEPLMSDLPPKADKVHCWEAWTSCGQGLFSE